MNRITKAGYTKRLFFLLKVLIINYFKNVSFPFCCFHPNHKSEFIHHTSKRLFSLLIINIKKPLSFGKRFLVLYRKLY